MSMTIETYAATIKHQNNYLCVCVCVCVGGWGGGFYKSPKCPALYPHNWCLKPRGLAWFLCKASKNYLYLHCANNIVLYCAVSEIGIAAVDLAFLPIIRYSILHTTIHYMSHMPMWMYSLCNLLQYQMSWRNVYHSRLIFKNARFKSLFRDWLSIWLSFPWFSCTCPHDSKIKYKGLALWPTTSHGLLIGIHDQQFLDFGTR
jgi:hypothetical protein